MLPLQGLRIVAVEHYGAGPYGTGLLADLGADVIKVELARTGGDISRAVGPCFLGDHDSHFFQTFNRNKRSLSLDLKHPRGREVFSRLVATADGLLGNLRGDQPEKLGLTYDALRIHNPRIVCAHLSAYGRSGSRRDWPGYDFLVQAEAGFLSLTGEPDGPPARFGLSMVDFMTGTMAVLGLVSGIIAARQTGIGRDVDVSLYDVAAHQLSYPAAWYLNEGIETRRLPRSAHPSIVPSQLFRTADGWIYLACQTQRFWEVLCERIGRPELAVDPRYATPADRLLHRDALTAELDAVLVEKTTAHWVDGFAGAVPVAPVYDLAQALENPFLEERRGVQTLDHPVRPGFRVVRSPLRAGDEVPDRPAPQLGADTEAILLELGYDRQAIDTLRADGAI
jgi:succinate---hydroxymethylglutarate CoA-transferase